MDAGDEDTTDAAAKCATTVCQEAPAVRVFWPGQTRDMCPACALRAQKIAQAMGFDLAIALLGVAAP